MTNESKTGIFGFLAGAAIGALAGVLFAPRSGKETRERIANKLNDSKEELEDRIEQARAEWSKAKGKAMNAATMTKEEVSDFVRFLFEEGKDLRERLKKDVGDSTDEVASKAKRAAENVRHSAN